MNKNYILRLISFIFFNIIVFSSLAQWMPVGTSTTSTDSSYFPSRTILSDNDNILAVSYCVNVDANKKTAIVCVFKNNSDTWEPVGDTLFADTLETASTECPLVLSDDGSILAFGLLGTPVRVYQNNSGTWNLIGVLDTLTQTPSGKPLSMSSDGQIIAISNNLSDSVRVYKNNSGTWETIGQTIEPSFALDLNGDGSMLAISDISFDTTIYAIYNNVGKVMIYKLDTDNYWKKKKTLYGKYTNGYFGYFVDFSTNGDVLAIGSSVGWSKKTIIKIYQDNSNAWTEIGPKIENRIYNKDTSVSISLNATGNIVAIGTSPNDSTTITRIYQQKDTLWKKVGEISENIDYIMRNRTSLSSDGYTVALSMGNYSILDSVAKKTKVYRYSCDEIDHLQLGADTAFCVNTSFTLNTNISNAIYKWNTDETTQDITVSDSGYYAVTVNALSCSNSDTIHLQLYELPEIHLPNDTLFCESDSIHFNLDAGAYFSYLWNTGDTTRTITIDSAGLYEVTVESNDHCFNSDDIYVAQIPFNNTFLTPDSIYLGDEIQLHGELPLWDTLTVSNDTILHIDPNSPDSLVFSSSIYVNDSGEFNLESICLNMEHSWVGDLIVELECPNGSKIQLFDGNDADYVNSYLGIPKSDDGSDEGPGEGWNYCFKDGASQLLANGPTQNVTTGDGKDNQESILGGTFKPTNDLSNLSSCPMKGNWTIHITDDQSADDGYLFYWKIKFATRPNNLTTLWQGDSIDDIHAIVTNAIPDSVGIREYNYSLTLNNVQCGTTLNVTVLDDPITFNNTYLTPDTIYLGDTVFLYGDTATGNGTLSWSGDGVDNADTNITFAIPSSKGNKDYTYTYQDSIGSKDTTLSCFVIEADTMVRYLNSVASETVTHTRSSSISSCDIDYDHVDSARIMSYTVVDSTTTEVVFRVFYNATYEEFRQNINTPSSGIYKVVFFVSCNSRSSHKIVLELIAYLKIIAPRMTFSHTYLTPDTLCLGDTVFLYGDASPSSDGQVFWHGDNVDDTTTNTSFAIPTSTGIQTYTCIYQDSIGQKDTSVSCVVWTIDTVYDIATNTYGTVNSSQDFTINNCNISYDNVDSIVIYNDSCINDSITIVTFRVYYDATYEELQKSVSTPDTGTYKINLTISCSQFAYNKIVLQVVRYIRRTRIDSEGIDLLLSSGKNIKLFPNPTKGIVKILGIENVDVNIYTLTGQKIASFKNVNTFNIEHLNSGSYIVELKTNHAVIIKHIQVLK